MIHETTGDLLLTKAQAIAHGVAPNDHFDQGLALALRERWPAMVKDFRHYARQRNPKPGTLWFWGGAEGTRIFNLLTQEGDQDQGSKPGRATVGYVNNCLKRLRAQLEKRKTESLAMPRLATGVGGLDWDDVRPLIEQHLSDLSTHVYVYTTYQAGVQAREPGLA